MDCGSITGKSLMRNPDRFQFQIVAAIALAAAFLTSCNSTTKTAQCNKLVVAINKGGELIKDIDIEQSKNAAELAGALDSVSQELEDFEFQDENLQKFQTRFAKIFMAMSQAFRETKDAMALVEQSKADSKGLAELHQAKTQVEKINQGIREVALDADSLAKEINDYCHSPESGES